MKRKYLGGLLATVLAGSAVAALPVGADAGTKPATVHTAKAAGKDAKQLARTTSRHLITSRAPQLRIGSQESYVANPVISSHGIQFASYDRLYRGLPVVGGDFVVVTDDAGQVLSTSVAQGRKTALPSITPTLSRSTAAGVARSQLSRTDSTSATKLVVWQKAGSHLAWETRVTGVQGTSPSSLSVYVDARSGKVLGTREHVLEGTGNSAYSGSSVSLPTTLSGSTYSMKNTNAATLVCQNATGNATFSGSDDLWGNGDATNRETGCVDAFYAAEMERQMLSSWLGRNGMNGTGGWVPIRVGLNDVNAYYDGTQVQIGHTQTGGKWIGEIDVVAHEFGHGIDDKTPGGISNGNTQEFVADTFGAMTEWYANNAVDTPDYTVGEMVNLVGTGPIRYMYNPSLAGDDNCYSAATPTAEVHAAAGPGNHWFYLLAEGTNPTNGQPTSSTCNGTTISGLGIQAAAKIMYNAMLMKTTSSSYLKYRTWTLTAAKNLYPGSCAEFNTVKAAWNAVSVPAQAADPTCSTSNNTVTVTNPGAQSGATGTATSLQITATDSAAGQTLTYTATGLPAGLSINSSTGLISGTPTTATTASVTVTATDTTGAAGSTTFTWTITGAGGTCSEVTATGTLANRASTYKPSSTGFASVAGPIVGCLTGPSGVDFDLYLQKRNGSSWTNVATSLGSTATEKITYNAAAGTYRWRVLSYSGSGAFTLKYDVP
ncbi:M4 family metallopeptidase [Nocardioides sp.]|uniref:M4 family metallopeptidase n=1 Tax=Nocardioides sp. TaxID=35761 RepID=UPI003D139186